MEGGGYSMQKGEIKPECKCNFPFCESGLTSNNDDIPVFDVSIFTEQGILIFTNRALTEDGHLVDTDDLELRCVRCGERAEWI